jgi:hypothetical protein
MADINRCPTAYRERTDFGFFEDFFYDQTDLIFVDTVTDTGTVAIGDAAGGIATLTPSDGTVGDNDEAYFTTPNELFLIAADKPIWGAARLKFAEANTDDANVFFGFGNAMVANTLIDNGGGMRASGTLVAIYKIDGENVWSCTARNGSEVTITKSTKTAGGSAYQELKILVHDYTSTQAQITYHVDGEYLKDSRGLPIVHTVLVASATEMMVGVGVKNGDTNLETLLVDYVTAWQVR